LANWEVFDMVYTEKLQGINHEMCDSVSLFDKLIWTIDEVCKFTAYKKGTVYNLVSNGNIPYRKRGKRLFFIPSEILNWLKGE
jgi:excisionase family DNA binding protein